MAKDWLSTYGNILLTTWPEAVIGVNHDGKVVAGNAAAWGLLGVSEGEFVGHHIHSVLHRVQGKSRHQRETCPVLTPLDSGLSSRKVRDVFSLPGGRRIFVEYSSYPIKLDGEIEGVMIVVGETSPLSKKQKNIEDEAKIFRAVFNSSLDAKMIVDNKGVILETNPAARFMWGIAPNTKPKITSLIPKEHLGEWQSFWITMIEQGKAELGLRRTKDGEEKSFIIRGEANVLGNIRHLLIWRDVTERIRSQERLDKFLSVAGHEFKTPIAVIKAYSQLIHKRLKGEEHERLRGQLKRIDEKADLLNQLVNSLMDEMRAQADNLPFEDEEVEIDQLVKEVVEERQKATQTHQLKIEGRTQASLYVDRKRVARAIDNLLTNAIKYSPNKEEVLIKMGHGNGEATITVIDYGVGIKTEEQKMLFTPFFRSNQAKQGKFPGLGIGLYLTKRVMENYGGTVRFNSRLDKGSSFQLAFPLK